MPSAREMYGEWAAPGEPRWDDLPASERGRWEALASWVQERAWEWMDDAMYEAAAGEDL